jgi:hypothetical protein
MQSTECYGQFRHEHEVCTTHNCLDRRNTRK